MTTTSQVIAQRWAKVRAAMFPDGLPKECSPAEVESIFYAGVLEMLHGLTRFVSPLDRDLIAAFIAAREAADPDYNRPDDDPFDPTQN